MHILTIKSFRFSKVCRYGTLWACLLLGSSGAFPQAAFAVRGHEFGFALGWGVSDGKAELEQCVEHCQSGIAGAGKGEFRVPVAAVVNEASGDFYVLDEANGRVDRFGPLAEYLGEFDGSGTFELEGKQELDAKPFTGQFLNPQTLAVDNSCVQSKLAEAECKAQDPSAGDVYVGDSGHEVIDKFSAHGEYIGQVPVPSVGAFLELRGIAVDSRGNVWIAEDQGLSHRGFDKFNDAVVNEHIQFVTDEGVRFQEEHPQLSIGREGNLFTNTVFESPFEEVIQQFTPHGNLLGVVAREQSTGVGVDYGSGDVFIDNRTSIGRFSPQMPFTEIERFGEGTLVEGQGLGINSVVIPAERERESPIFVADRSAADLVAFPLEGPKRPTIEDVSVSDVTSNSASWHAVVNPRGARSEYKFEYGICPGVSECHSSRFEVAAQGRGSGAVGSVLDFDQHALEVHPQNLEPETVYHLRVMARNEKNAPHEFVESRQIVFRTQPGRPPVGNLDGRGWEMVSPVHKHGTLVRQILGEDVIQAAADGGAFTFVTNSPTESEPHGFSNLVQVYSRRTQDGWASEDLALPHLRATGQSVGGGEEYRLFSEDLSHAVVQPLGGFEPATSPEASEQTPYVRTNLLAGDLEMPCASACYQPLVTTANVREGAAFGEEGQCPPHVICGPRVVGATPDARNIVLRSSVGLTGIAGDKGGLYEWSEGVLSLISVLPGGKPAAVASGPALGGGGVTRGAISADGSRVVWSENAGVGLYLRDTLNGETVEINKGIAGIPVFQAANVEDSRVFFTDGPSGDLYVYEVGRNQSLRLTTPIVSGEGTEVQGKIVGVSKDGSYVYFVASGRLSQEAKPVEHRCEVSRAFVDRCYMYMLHAEGGVWGVPTLVATLSGADFPDFAGVLSKLPAQVSTDGRWLVFMSQLELTSYDNRDASSGARVEEVFLFDGGSRKLVCVSCDPTGARPVGVEYSRLQGGLVAGDRVWPGDTWLAANVPGWTPYELDESFYQSRYLLDDGRVFFNSNDALVPRDVNGTEDVYEYEPAGVGSCSSGDTDFVEASDGCIGLISAGTSRQESAFLDASVSGSDVFFLTASPLVASDFDTALDVYDAHECRSVSPCLHDVSVPASTCVAESSCKNSPMTQLEVFGAPASAVFSGLGNTVIVTNTALVHAETSRQRLLRAMRACQHRYRHSRKGRVECLSHVRGQQSRARGKGTPH